MSLPIFSRPVRGRFALLGVATLLVLTGVIYHHRSRGRPDSRPRGAGLSVAARPAVGGQAAAVLPREETGETGNRASFPSPAAAPRPAQPAPEAVTRAFPSITEVTPDWRDFRPESVTVAPYPDLPVKFTRTALRDEGRYVTWIGRNSNLPGASLVGVATAKGYDAILVMPGSSQFSYHVRGDTVVVAESVPGESGCGNAPAKQDRKERAVSAGLSYEISYAPGIGPLPDTYADTAPLKVDVLIAYDADTLAAAAAKSSDPVGYIDGQMKALLETSNLTLSQSLVTAFAWRYIGAVAAPAYTRTGKLEDDLNAMEPGGAIASWVKSTRYQRGADQITMLVGGTNNWGGYASSPKQVATSADYAASVIKWGESYLSFAHEWAHNFGCKHDRGHYSVVDPKGPAVAAPDRDGYWCYGQLWPNPPVPGVPDPGTSGTIMSYADYLIPYFSNPNITVHVTGLLAGWSWNPDLGLQQTGRVETDPKAAYNVRVLNEQALPMSNIAEEITVPAIAEQPTNTSVERGSYINLSVKATGGGLAYQWLKGGVALSGATTPTYSKFSEDADAGTYTVTVSNFSGTVTSNAATVTITVPPPPPPPPASGGGGGGAPSIWFLGLLGLGGVGRWVQSRSRCSADRAGKKAAPHARDGRRGECAEWRRFRT